MNHSETTGNCYLISHLRLISGLTDRTIRSYLASGILQGEKINGLWHFTPDQVDTFLHHPAVQPSIMSKRNSIVYDFMKETKKAHEEACMILDLPGHEAKRAGEFFSYRITNSNMTDIQFSYDHTAGSPRIILRGRYEDIIHIVSDYFTSIQK